MYAKKLFEHYCNVIIIYVAACHAECILDFLFLVMIYIG